MKRIAVWEMILEAVNAIGGDAISVADIRKYILNHYGAVNEGTISAQINACCVNRQGRVGMPENHKPRIADGRYDFLYSVGRGYVTQYDPQEHGVWEIAECDGKLLVKQIGPGNVTPIRPATVIPVTMHTARSARKRPDIESPCTDAVLRYVDAWNSLENYSAQEIALNKLFWEYCPENRKLEDVLLKAGTLNAFYATNVYNIFALAKHILSLDIDERLKIGDESLVTDIASGHGVKNATSGKELHLYSFATKYCSHHRPEIYPIYDSYVGELLVYLRDIDHFADFRKEDLRNITIFRQTLLSLQEFYSLEAFSLKEIDKYMWQYGKEKFSKVAE